jgi:hypothetical protein
MARRTNWLRKWKPFTWSGLRPSEITAKKDKIKTRVKNFLKKWDENHPNEKSHKVTFNWSKLSTGDKVVAHLDPPETESNHGGVPPVMSPNTPPQPS